MDQNHDNQDQMIRQDPAMEEPLPVSKRKKAKRHSLPPIFLEIFHKNPFMTFGALVVLVSLAFCLIIAPMLGKSVGVALGSFRGVTQGITDGTEAGRDKGLSAEDTVVTIGTKMAETGKLQVMLADLRLSDIYKQGPEKDPQYAALLEMRGEGIFTVDLTQAKAVYDASEDRINITIPEPEFTPYLDDSILETLAEYRPRFDNGSTIHGYSGYLNSRVQLEKRAQEAMLTMMEPAKASALTQVEFLARSINGSSASIQVGFAGGET